MIGMRPISTLECRTRSRPRVYSMSTRIGAAYVMSRSRQSCGFVPIRLRSSSARAGNRRFWLLSAPHAHTKAP
jgi:hypothetical protein